MKEPYKTLFKNIDFGHETFNQFDHPSDDFRSSVLNKIQQLKEISQSQTEILRILCEQQEDRRKS